MDITAEQTPAAPAVPPGQGHAPQPRQVQPSMEWIELRDFYSREVRPEGDMAGYKEFLTVCKERQWIGMARLTDDVCKRLKTDQWTKSNGKFRPSLARYLSEHMWTAPIGDPSSEAPLPPPENIPDGWDISKLDDPGRGDAFFVGMTQKPVRDTQTIALPSDGFIGRRRKILSERTEAAV